MKEKNGDAISIPLSSATLLVAILLVVPLASCGRSEEATNAAAKPPDVVRAESSKTLALTEEEIKQAGIKVEVAQVQPFNEPVTLTGTIIANQDRIAKVAPRLPGRVVSVTVAQGARVKKGQTLTVLESIELGEVRSAYLQARSEAAVAEAALGRTEKLAAEDIVPQKDYLRSKADAERARASLRAAADKLSAPSISATAL